MSRYDEENMYGGNHSRARSASRGKSGNSSRSKGTRSGELRGETHRSSASRGGSHKASSPRGSSGRGNIRSTSSGSGINHRKRHRKSGPDFTKLAIGGVLLIAAITMIVFLVKGIGGKPEEIETETETTSVPETELQKEVMVDGINITGMSREDADRKSVV